MTRNRQTVERCREAYIRRLVSSLMPVPAEQAATRYAGESA